MKKLLAVVLASVLVVFTPGAGAAAPINIADPVAIIAHKTGPLDAPENTHQGIARAKQINPELKWVEVDVRWNKSNFPFLMHHATVDDTTDYSGNLRDYWFDTVIQMNAAAYGPWDNKRADGSWVYPQYQGMTTDSSGKPMAKVHPSYAWEFINEANKQNVNLLLDVKEVPTQADAAKLIDYINRFSYASRVIYMASPASVKTMKAWYPNLDYMVIEYPPADMTRTIESIKANGATGYAIPFPRVTKTLVDYYHSGGIKLFTWTSDNVETDVSANWQKAINYGVDALITNEHLEAQSLLP